MRAPRVEVRLERMVAVTAMLMDRAGPLLEVAQQAAATEPAIAEAVQEGRQQTRRTLREFWLRIHDDGLHPSGSDVLLRCR